MEETPKETPVAGTYYRITKLEAPSPLVATGTGHRFSHDDEPNETSYLADSPQTAVHEVEGSLSASHGFSVKIRPDQSRLVTVELHLNRVWDFRDPSVIAALDPSTATRITAEEHSEELEDLGRDARRRGVQGFLWKSTKTQRREAVCLVVFLENVRPEEVCVVEDRILGRRPE